MAYVVAAAAAAAAKRRKRCRYCGNHLSLFARFCNECGHEVPKPSKPAVLLLATLVVITTLSVFITMLFI